MVAMFRVTAGMGWLDSLPWAGADGAVNYPNVAFLASYVVIANWTLLQVRLEPCCVRFAMKSHNRLQGHARAQSATRSESDFLQCRVG